MDVKKNSNNVTIINDCYNANYDSMKAKNRIFIKNKRKKKNCCIRRYVRARKIFKKFTWKSRRRNSKNKIDILITVGNEAKNIVEKAVELGLKKENTYNFNTNEKAISLIKNTLKPEDVVLIKASNGMNFNKIVEEIKEC